MIIRAFFDRPATARLSSTDTTRLERWKQCYRLQTEGFTRDEAKHLLFYRRWFWNSPDRTAQVGPS